MPEKAENKNRRAAERGDVAYTLNFGVIEPYSLRARLGLSDDLEALMRDLSDSGMAMITKFELPVEASLRIKFNFINLFLTGQERYRQIEISGVVVSCTDLGRGDYRAGVKFNNISEEDKLAIRNFIKRSKMSGGSNV